MCAIPGLDEAATPWIPTEPEQEAKRAVFAVLQERFPQSDKAAPDRKLRAGMVGIAIDTARRGYAAVVDPTLVDVAALDAELKAAATAEHARRPSVRKVDIRAEASCHSAAELVDALNRIRVIAQKHKGIGGWHPDPNISRIHVDAIPGSPGATELERQLGDRVSLEDD